MADADLEQLQNDIDTLKGSITDRRATPMWLYTLAEWSCTRSSLMKSDFQDVKERLVSRFTRGLTPTDGLRLLKEYTDRFNSKPVKGNRRYCVEYRLISMTQLPDDTGVEPLSDLECLEISRETVEAALL